MSISISVPSVSLSPVSTARVASLAVDHLSLAGSAAVPAVLDGTTAPSGSQFADTYSPAHPLPLPSSPALSEANLASESLRSASLDPLTPRGLTTDGAVALAHVIGTVTTTLQSVQGSTADGLPQLVRSPGFRVLLQVLNAGAGGSAPNPPGSSGANATASGPSGAASYPAPGGSEQIASLIDANKPSGSSASASYSAVPSPGSSASGAAGGTPAPGGGNTAHVNSVNPAPYFQKMLGELESTYKAAAGNSGASSLNASELDLFLKWLSINGSSHVVASA